MTSSSIRIGKIFKELVRKTSTLSQIVPACRAPYSLLSASTTRRIEESRGKQLSGSLAGTNNKKLQVLDMSTASLPQPQQKLSLMHDQLSKYDLDQLSAAFPDFVKDVTWGNMFLHLDETRIETDCIAEGIKYQMEAGEKESSFLTLSAYKAFEKPENLTPENIKLANIVAWCTELIKTHLENVEDIVANAEIRNGIPCNHRVQGAVISPVACAAFISSLPDMLLQKHFPDHPFLIKMADSTMDVNLEGHISGSIARTAFNRGHPKLNHFTMSNFKNMTKLGLSSYLFSYPLTMALYLAKIGDAQLHQEVASICEKLGNFIVVKDNFLDCFGNQDAIGKSQGHLTWLAVRALEKCNPAQRKLMEMHYGKMEPASWNLVRNIYEDLGLPKEYAIYKEESFKESKTSIRQMSKGLSQHFFSILADKVYLQ